MTASESTSFSTGIWSAVKSLSLLDTIQYLHKFNTIFEPENGIPLFSANPHSYNRTALYAVLLLHQHSLTHSPNNISEASERMLDSISLVDEPGYERFFFLLASHSMHLFEYTTELPHLGQAIELLQRFSAVQEPGTPMHFVAAVEYACACLQYSLKADVGEALIDARKIMNEACQASPQSPWVSAFGDTRTKVILADLIRNRNDMCVVEEDCKPTMHASLRLLDGLTSPPDRHYTALQILVISVILFLSQTAVSEEWLGALDALDCVLGRSGAIHSSMHKALLLLSDAISRCSDARAICLIYMADILDVEILDPPKPLEDINRQAAWPNEWESAKQFLQDRIKTFEEQNYGDDATSTPIFLMFEIHGDVLQRSSLSNARFRELPPVAGHICVFNLGMAPVSDCQEVLHNSKISGEFTHYIFFDHLQRLCDSVSPDDLKYFSDHPGELDQLFKRSKHLDNNSAEPIATWKKSPGVIAYLLMQIGQKDLANKKTAARQMLKVDCGCEPGYIPFLYRLAGDLRNYETDDRAVSISSRLIQEFLRSQRRGTSMHFVGTMELATNYLIEFLSQSKGIALLNVSLELFREAMESRSDGPWVVEAKKVVVLGYILHTRLKYFAESETSLSQTIDHFTTLWDALPVGRPFSLSVLEVITTTALLNLARILEFEEWINALKLLGAGLDLYINGTEVEGLEGLETVKNNASLLELVLDRGTNTQSFSFASKAMCLFHLSDILRSIALDMCRNPGYLALSAKLYRRSLRLKFEDTYQNEDDLQSCWDREREGLIEALTSLVQPRSVGASPPKFGEVPLSIFRYCATRSASQNKSWIISHSCFLRYHPTRVSYLPQVFQETPPPSPVSEGSSTSDMPHVPPWPNDFMAPPPLFEYNSEARSMLHSTVVPGIATVIHDERQNFFKMPLEARTIKALRRTIEEFVRSTESDLSHLSEKAVHHSSEAVYWDPKDVQLGTRIAKIKKGTSSSLARMASLQALLSRGPEQSLKLIESSRALFWTRLLRLQTTFEGLPEDLACQLEDTAHKLDACKSQSVASVSKEDMRWQFELEAEFSHLLAEARKIPGFENLLGPKGHEELLEASVGGPVIILMGDVTYAALVVTSKGVDSVLLPDLTSTTLTGLQSGLNRENASARGSLHEQVDDGEPEEARGGRPRARPQASSYESFLARLWDLVVKPIFEFMGLLSSVPALPNPRPRLWWCPTGDFTFLPLHAAGSGFGTEKMESVSKYVVSSYIPTLSALISGRSKMSQASCVPISDLRSLVLAQPTTKGYANLPNTVKELALVESLTPSSQLLQIGSGPLISSNANKTVEEAVEYLKQASILHLACHGHQDRADPLNSGFELSDGRLTVAKLIKCRPPKAFLAFLSACESAANDLEAPDESLNLSVAMLYAGFSSVIGTLWSMNDNDGPLIARTIYEELFKNPTASLKPEIIPYALDLAIQKLQQNGVHPSRWATYIHVGI